MVQYNWFSMRSKKLPVVIYCITRRITFEIHEIISLREGKRIALNKITNIELLNNVRILIGYFFLSFNGLDHTKYNMAHICFNYIITKFRI